MRKALPFIFILMDLFYVTTVLARETEMRIPYAGDKSIYGIISEPSSKGGRHGIVIISHGFNGTHHFGRDYFEVLNNLGYAVYSFDFPCGSIYSLSDSNTMDMSITDEKEALKTIVRYFRRQEAVDTSRIVLIGESQGGLVSALAASELKGQVSRLVLIYPALCIPDDWKARYPTEEDIPDVSEIWGVKLGRKFMMDIRSLNVYDEIGKYMGPVLIIHGTDDKVVPLDYSRRAQKTYQNATLKIIDKAGHGFRPEERKVSNGYVHAFLRDGNVDDREVWVSAVNASRLTSQTGCSLHPSSRPHCWSLPANAMRHAFSTEWRNSVMSGIKATDGMVMGVTSIWTIITASSYTRCSPRR